MSYSNTKAFTLVELIVVITIVGILSTVGFVSYSGYLTGARDSNRFSQLTKLSDSLQVYATTKSLPLPDDYVEVTATGVVLGYQGYAGVDVLETIDYTNGGKDPKDDSYFTYYLTKDRKHLQLTAFLEESLTENNLITTSYAADYSERYPKSYGNDLGVITDESNTPIQEISSIQTDGFLDVFSTPDTYVVHYNDSTLVGNNVVLKGIIGGGGLVGYWSFEELVGGSFKDLSNNNASGTVSGGVNVSSDGVIGNSVNFDGVDGRYFIDLIQGIGSSKASPHTISAWIKPTVLPGDCGGNNSCREWLLILGNYDVGNREETGPGTHHWLIGGTDGPAQFGIYSGSQKVPNLIQGEWQYIAAVFDTNELELYFNGKTVGTKSREIKNTEMNVKNSKLFLGGTGHQAYYNGLMDELRIYNRALDYREIQNIYNSEKKALGL